MKRSSSRLSTSVGSLAASPSRTTRSRTRPTILPDASTPIAPSTPIRPSSPIRPRPPRVLAASVGRRPGERTPGCHCSPATRRSSARLRRSRTTRRRCRSADTRPSPHRHASSIERSRQWLRTFGSLKTQIIETGTGWDVTTIRHGDRAMPGLARDDETFGGGPLDAQSGVVPADPAGRLRHVVVRHLVEDLGVVLEGLVALCESLGDVGEALVGGGQLDAEPFDAGRRVGAQVDHDEEDRAARAADELDLGVRRLLVVQAAERVDVAGCGSCCSARSASAQPCSANSRSQNVRARNPRSSRVALDVDHVRAIERVGGEDHGRQPGLGADRIRQRSSSSSRPASWSSGRA